MMNMGRPDMLEMLEEVGQEVAPVEETPSLPTKITSEELLRTENFSLRLTNFELRKKELERALIDLEKSRDGLFEEIDKERQRLAEKYGIDVARFQVKPDGTIVR